MTTIKNEVKEKQQTPLLIETVGVALFGESWMTQIARSLGVQRQTVNSWHKRGNLPIWAKDELKNVVESRRRDVLKISKYFEDNKNERNVS